VWNAVAVGQSAFNIEGQKMAKKKAVAKKTVKRKVVVKNTDITVLLDRSGSMSWTKAAMESGFNEFLTKQRAVKGSCNISMHSFDEYGVEDQYVEKAIADAPPLQLKPRGMTPLNDAIMTTIDKMEGRLKGKKKRVVFVIITDGLENASTKYTSVDVSNKITEKKKAGWVVIYIGSNQDAIQVGASIGLKKGSALTYKASSVGTQSAMNSLSDATSRIRQMSASQYTNTVKDEMGIFAEIDRYNAMSE
jgi:hypothetical protein